MTRATNHSMNRGITTRPRRLSKVLDLGHMAAKIGSHATLLLAINPERSAVNRGVNPKPLELQKNRWEIARSHALDLQVASSHRRQPEETAYFDVVGSDIERSSPESGLSFDREPVGADTVD